MNEFEQWHWQESGKAWKGVGIYHITLVVTDRRPLLGTLVINGNEATQAKVQRSQLGQSLMQVLANIPKYHPEVRILQYCLMPDHLHAILHVTRQMPVGIGTVVRGFWQGAKKIGREYVLSVSADNIRSNKQNRNTNFRDKHGEYLDGEGRQHCGGMAIDPIFREMPFIRPMSRKGQLNTMMQYVKQNPQRLATKRLRPGYFHVQKDIEIGNMRFDGVGNATLLLAEQHAAVHVRRTMVEAAEHGENLPLRNYMNGCVMNARKGCVMVSPFISPQEKEIMEVLLREHLSFILLAENGFREYYKPSEALFDACAAGRILILSPWKHDADKKRISRADCVALNTMAENICTTLCPIS